MIPGDVRYDHKFIINKIFMSKKKLINLINTITITYIDISHQN